MDRLRSASFQFLAFLEAHPFHVLDDPIRTKQTHQVVFERDEKVGGAGIALAGATASQLAVDAAGFVAFGADNVQAAGFRHARPEFNIGAAAGHIGGDGDGAALAGAGDNLGFLLVILGVEDGMDDAIALEHAREQFAYLDGDRADQDGPALAVDLANLLQNSVVLLAPGLVNRVVGVSRATGRLVGMTSTPSL